MNDILNPYIAGAPVVETSMFFGREDVFSWIERSLAGKYVDHMLVLHGQRRVGKTSILKQIPNFLPNRYIQVFFDLQGRTNTTLDRFLWWMAREIARTLNQESGISIARPNRENFTDNPEYLINEFLPGLRPHLRDHVLLLTLDEFDTLDRLEIQESFASPLIAYLRRLMEIEWLNFIFSIGSSGDKLENMQASYTDFFKSALYRKISFLIRDDCHRLITKPVEGIIKFNRKAVDGIYEITSGHPYFTQLMCHELFSLCQKTGSRNISKDDVESILEDVIERGTVNLKFVWDEADDLEKWVLAGLAHLDGGTTTQKLSELLQQQRVRFSDSDLNSAIIHLRDKDVIDEKNQFIIHLMQMWLQANRPLDRVREELEEVNPIANRYIEIGDEYRDMGQGSQAIESYQQALNVDSGNIKAQSSIGSVHLEEHTYQEAAAAFELALQIDDEDVISRTGFCDANLALGDQARGSDETEEAVEFYQKILVINPAHTDARQRLADIYTARAEDLLADGKDDDALSAFNQAIDFTPEDDRLSARYEDVLAQKKSKVVSEWLSRADKSLSRQRWDEAAGFVEQAIKLDPENPELRTKLLEVKDAPRQSKIKGCKHEAEQAIQRGNFENAITAIETAVQLAPEDTSLAEWLETTRSDHLNARLNIYRDQAKKAIAAGDWDGAATALKEALKLSPNDVDLQKELAETETAKQQARLDELKSQAENATQAENWAEALTAWENYLALNPKDPSEIEAALQHVRKYTKISGDYAEAQDAIRKKRYGRATELLQGIIAQDPTYKATSRLLVEAVEADKATPIWQRPWVYWAIGTVVVGVVLGILMLTRQGNSMGGTLGMQASETPATTMVPPTETPLLTASSTSTPEPPTPTADIIATQMARAEATEAARNDLLVFHEQVSESAITDLDWSEDGILVIASGSRDVYFLESINQGELSSIDMRRDIYSLDWQPGTGVIAVGTRNGYVIRYDYASQEDIEEIIAGSGIVVDVEWSGDGRFLAVATDEGFVRSWNYSGDQSAIWALPASIADLISKLSWSFDGSKIMLLRDNNDLSVRKVKTDGYHGNCQSADLSDDGEFVACGSTVQGPQDDGTVDLSAHLSVHRELHQALIAGVSAHIGLIYQIEFSPDGEYFASVGEDGTLRIWTGIYPLDQNHDLTLVVKLVPEVDIYNLAWSPDGDYIAAGDVNGRLWIWRVAQDGTLSEDTTTPDADSTSELSEPVSTASALEIALETIQNEEPFFERDFDTYEDQKLIITGAQNNSLYWHLTDFQSDRFAVEFDVEILEPEQDSGCLLNINNDEYTLRNIFWPGGEVEVDHLGVDGLEITIGSGKFNSSTSNTATLMVLSDQISLFVNGELAFTVLDSKGGAVYTSVSYEADSLVTCGFDNFKLWDLSEVDF